MPGQSPSTTSESHYPFLVIPAGGRGLRMGGGLPKQFRDWDGRPLLQVTVEAFLAPGMPQLAGIALAVPESHMEEARSWSFRVPCHIVHGGDTRQESVWLALKSLPNLPLAPVMIHDAVRPFPPSAPLWEALEALNRYDGVLLGEPSTDTLKRVDAQGPPIDFVHGFQVQDRAAAAFQGGQRSAGDHTVFRKPLRAHPADMGLLAVSGKPSLSRGPT